MPFKSEAQRRFMYSQHPELAKEFEEKTPKGKKLPEHVKNARVSEAQEASARAEGLSYLIKRQGSIHPTAGAGHYRAGDAHLKAGRLHEARGDRMTASNHYMDAADHYRAHAKELEGGSPAEKASAPLFHAKAARMEGKMAELGYPRSSTHNQQVPTGSRDVVVNVGKPTLGGGPAQATAKAAIASKSAHHASAEIAGSRQPSDHLEAAHLHEEAAQAHHVAAVAHSGGTEVARSQDAQVKEHMSERSYHLTVARQHRADAAEASKGLNKGPTMRQAYRDSSRRLER